MRHLAREQNDCLRMVTGAYKTTPIAVLEDITGCPPINLVASARAANFVTSTAPTKAWQTAWERMKLLIQSRRRGRRRQPEPLDPMQKITSMTTQASIEEAWQTLRDTERQKRRLCPYIPWSQQRKVWQRLTRPQSSLLTQVISGHVGLKAYLFSRRVLDITSPWCQCGKGRETPAHLFLDCELLERPEGLRSNPRSCEKLMAL